MPKKKDVTNNDGGASDEQEHNDDQTSPHPVDENLSARDQIVKNRVAEFEEEIGEKVDREVDDEPPEKEGTVQGTDDSDAATMPVDKEQKTDPDEKPTAEPATYKIVVDGMEQEVTADQLMAAGKSALQKESAADKRLEDASRLFREAKEAKAASERPASPESPAAGSGGNEDARAASEEKDIAVLKEAAEDAEAAYIKAINYGEEDEALEASRKARAANEAYLMAKIGGGHNPPTIDEDKIASKIQTRIKYGNIVSEIRKPVAEGGFEDITSNQHLYVWAAQEVDKLLAGGAPDEYDTYRQACELVRSSILNLQQSQGGDNGNDSPTKGNTDQPTQEMTTKIERKRKLDSIDSAAGRQPSPKEEKPPDTRAVINKMARNRIGQ